MSTFFNVFAMVIWFVLLLVALGGTIWWVIVYLDESQADTRFKVIGASLRILAGCVAMSILIAIPITAGAFNTNNAEHCGPGTEYRESRHYNAATKSTQTIWWCEA